jgi:siroheme decarboxylase
MNPSSGLDPLDRVLLQRVQDEFPLDPRPFRVLGRRLGLTEQEVLDRLDNLHRRGILRHIAPILETRRTGITASTLVAMRLGDDRITEIAGIVTNSPSVSHNYRRDHEYNLWFTIAEPSEARLEETLAEIRHRTGVPEADILDLRMVRRFKIDVRFRFVQEDADEVSHGRDRP